jgi:hypothetical protein
MKNDKFYLQKDGYVVCFWNPYDSDEAMKWNHYCLIKKDGKYNQMTHLVDCGLSATATARVKYAKFLREGYKPVESIEEAVKNLNFSNLYSKAKVVNGRLTVNGGGIE